MSNPWFRMYSDLLDNPKVQRLEPALFKTWVNILCVVSKKGRELPSIPDLAFALRISDSDCQQAVDKLLSAKLLDSDDGKLVPHDWDDLQFLSDTSKSRTRAYRERKNKSPDKTSDVTVTSPIVISDVTVTAQDTDTDTDTERLLDSESVLGSAHTREPESRERQIVEFDFQARSRFVPELFEPDEMFHVTHRHRNPAANYHVELERFKAHEYPTPKSDWQRAWISWWLRAKPDNTHDTRNSLERQTDELLGVDRRYL